MKSLTATTQSLTIVSLAAFLLCGSMAIAQDQSVTIENIEITEHGAKAEFDLVNHSDGHLVVWGVEATIGRPDGEAVRLQETTDGFPSFVTAHASDVPEQSSNVDDPTVPPNAQGHFSINTGCDRDAYCVIDLDLTFVMFDDGSYVGDHQTAARVFAGRRGERQAIAEFLQLINQHSNQLKVIPSGHLMLADAERLLNASQESLRQLRQDGDEFGFLEEAGRQSMLRNFVSYLRELGPDYAREATKLTQLFQAEDALIARMLGASSTGDEEDR